MDLTSYPEDMKHIDWTAPVAVNVSIAMAQSPVTELIPPLLYGLGAIEAPESVNNGTAAVLFYGERYFATVAEAEAWKKTAEYRQLQDMIGSFNG